jgi:hypothetical protein
VSDEVMNEKHISVGTVALMLLRVVVIVKNCSSARLVANDFFIVEYFVSLVNMINPNKLLVLFTWSWFYRRLY